MAAPMPFDGAYHANPVFCVLHHYHCPIYERACDGNRIPMVPKRTRRRHELRLHIVPAMRRRGILLPESTLHRAEFNNIATAETSGALTTISAAQKRTLVKFQRAVCGQEVARRYTRSMRTTRLTARSSTGKPARSAVRASCRSSLARRIAPAERIAGLPCRRLLSPNNAPQATPKPCPLSPQQRPSSRHSTTSHLYQGRDLSRCSKLHEQGCNYSITVSA